MERPVLQPRVVLDVQGSEAVNLHETVFAALATQSEVFQRLRQLGKAAQRDLEQAVDQLLAPEADHPDQPRSWRFIQTAHAFLGPAYFAAGQCTTVATCGDSEVHVTDSGFVMRTDQGAVVGFTAIETTKTQTALIREDGHEAGSLTSEQVSLAQALNGGHPYVTAVPASFTVAVQQPLFRLRARLLQAKGEQVLLS